MTIQSLKDSEKKNNRKKGKRYLTGEEKGDILRKLSCRGNPTGRLATENSQKRRRKKLEKTSKKRLT